MLWRRSPVRPAHGAARRRRLGLRAGRARRADHAAAEDATGTGAWSSSASGTGCGRSSRHHTDLRHGRCDGPHELGRHNRCLRMARNDFDSNSCSGRVYRRRRNEDLHTQRAHGRQEVRRPATGPVVGSAAPLTYPLLIPGSSEIPRPESSAGPAPLAHALTL